MDRRLRRAPDAEWVLMYRRGLTRARIASLVRVPAAAVGYHLAIARRLDPGLEVEHQTAAGIAPAPRPSPMDLARMDEVIVWVSARGQWPKSKAPARDERALAQWLFRRRREAAAGILHSIYCDGLAQIPGWADNRRAAADEARWLHRLTQLAAFRDDGHDWPRHDDFDSEQEHILGVWIHTQRYTHRRGELDPVKLKLLDDTAPGWQTGRKRGRPRRL
ncbi:helicase associated domain-containing protein [Arthrobacter sp. PAMC25284]|uniref:helicase associated domain-containing protein n=1 Tax=Arthrobacter sp. PAMC25284 TaxID=2861279 RepID=UPI001C62A11B|nr:helicase associated domain-containing protein [Arthrobacter sp. PAMC25284]QYF88497.1 helicase associated domain-containing protein [Arthrobacter sp. PAMC25284]